MRRSVSTTTPAWMPASRLTIAAAMALSASLPALAQSFTQSGTNTTTPNNLLPFVGNPSVLDFSSEQVRIGSSAAGSFSASAGALFKAGRLDLGTSGTGVGTASFSDLGTLVQLSGTGFQRLNVGAWGVGTMTVSAGALVDATVNSALCAPPNTGCNVQVGNGAGSTGTLNITGAGSELRSLRDFSVGHAAVFTVANGGFDFGTPGGRTDAFVNVLGGGSLRTERATVGNFTLDLGNLGSELAFGTVVVSGVAGNGDRSQWILTHNSVDNQAAGLVIGSNVNGHGNVTVSNGGKLLIDGSAGPGPNDFLNIASNGGKGALTVTGAGSSVDMVGKNTVLQVGRSGAGAQGSFSVLAGATASALYVTVGRDGASGTMLIDGAGSALTQSGVGTVAPTNNGGPAPAFANIGRDGGTGQATLSNGGQWLISDGGGDGRASSSNPGLAIGRGANSTGSLLITGAGSKLEIVSTSLNPAAGVGDNYNAFLAVGFDNAATTTGTLMIGNGGKLVMTGNAVSTAADPRATQLAIGGRSGVAGTGVATVTGANSEIIIQGQDALITIGRTAGGSGTLDVLDGGKVSGTSMLIGTGTTGTVNIDNAQVELAGHFNEAGVGAGLGVGRDGGSGILNMTNGATLSINPDTFGGGGLGIGGTMLAPGGIGTATLSGGSTITIGGTVAAGVSVGLNGTGTLSLSGASMVDAGTGNAEFGRTTTGTGHLVLQGGSVLSARQVFFGGSSDSVAGGTGFGTVTGLGSELKATGTSAFIGVGIGGNGTLTLTDQGKLSGTILAVGRSGGTGTLVADSATIDLSGQQTAAQLTGARLTVGTGGGTGTTTFNNSTIGVRNAGSDGAGVLVGGSNNYPSGTGVMNLNGGSQLTVSAATGAQANVTVGRDGTGTLNLAGGSTVNVGSDSGSGFIANGNVYVGRQSGGVGLLNLSGGSTINAGFVGVGVSAAGSGNALNGAPAGTGTLVLNNSTINTSRFELGAGSLLTGDGGTIDAGTNGPVVIAGTISPGNSPGRLRIRCDITMLFGSQLILDIDDTGASFDIDQLIIGNDSKFDLQALQIVFNFIGATNPDEFAQTPGGFNLDKFLRAEGDGTTTQGLSTLFERNGNNYADWDDVLDPANFSATSAYYDVTEFRLGPNGEVSFAAAAIPEPSSVALALLALLAMATLSRQRRARRA